MLGKETIGTQTRGITKGRNGSSNTNYQNAGRELLTLDEVRLLDNSNAIIFIRGEKPIMDKKFDILSHTNIKLTEDGGAMPYTHSKDDKYLIEDLSVSDIENLEFIELEDADNEKNSEHEQN